MRLYGKKSKKNKRSLVSLYTVSLVRFYGVLHSALRLRLTFAAQIGNESSEAGGLHACSGAEPGKAGESHFNL